MRSNPKTATSAKRRNDLAADANELAHQLWSFSQQEDISEKVPYNELEALYEGAGILLGYAELLKVPPQHQEADIVEKMKKYRDWISDCQAPTNVNDERNTDHDIPKQLNTQHDP